MERKIMKNMDICHNPTVEPLIEKLEIIDLTDELDVWSILKKALEKTFVENTEFDYPILIQNI